MWSSTFRSPSPPASAPPKHASGALEIKVRNLDVEHASPTSPSAPLSMGWLLRLFRSDFFDAFMAVTYLYRYRDSPGVHDYLCNELYHLADADLEAFMPQVCNLLVHHARHSPGLERFVLDKCAESMHMALQVFWFLQAAVEDGARAGHKDVEARVRMLRTRCETAALNGSRGAMLEAAASRMSAAALNAVEFPFSKRKREDAAELFLSSSAGHLNIPEHGPWERRQAEGGKRGLEMANGGPGTAGGDAADGVAETISAITDAVGKASMKGVGEGEGEGEGEREGSEGVSSEEVGSPEHADVLAIGEGLKVRRMESGEEAADYDPATLLTMKQERFDYFNDSVSIAQAFVRLSMTTKDKLHDQRQAHLSAGLDRINDILLRRMKGDPGIPLREDAAVPDVSEVAALGLEAALRSIHLPLTRASSQALRILRVHSEEVVILTSRTRAPYMVNIEVLPTEMMCSDKLIFCEQRVVKPVRREANGPTVAGKPPRPGAGGLQADQTVGSAGKPAVSPAAEEDRKTGAPNASNDESNSPAPVRQLSEKTPAERQRANVRRLVYGDAYSKQPQLFELADGVTLKVQGDDDHDGPEEKAKQAVILGIYGELWSWKEERILGKSPFRNLAGTRLMRFIVKAGDDLRQEQLAIQLISQFRSIFKEEGVDVYLRPFTVMSVSSEAGFVEVIPDSVSVHSLKKRTPNFVSVLDYFERAFGAIGTLSFRAAQRRFIRSMAGYSLVTYFLQIKDRHNGNIMIDVHGRIIHIDFGFMLTNSPGAIKFENVPFKLTEEYLQVICAKKNVQDLAEASKTEGYRYFQELFVLGLLAARKHYEKITTLVEIMTEGTTMPCMTGGHSIVETLRSRFAVGMPEEQCINFGLGLIEESRLSWRSASYDRFQAYSNGYR